MEFSSMLESAKALRDQLAGLAVLRAAEMGVAGVTDEEKAAAGLAAIRGVEVPGLPEGAAWSAGKRVSSGDGVTHAGKSYVCLQTHITQAGWEPGAAAALWAEARADLAPWAQPQGAHDAYKLGARVTHKGKTWESTADNNIWEPGVYGWAVMP